MPGRWLRTRSVPTALPFDGQGQRSKPSGLRCRPSSTRTAAAGRPASGRRPRGRRWLIGRRQRRLLTRAFPTAQWTGTRTASWRSPSQRSWRSTAGGTTDDEGPDLRPPRRRRDRVLGPHRGGGHAAPRVGDGRRRAHRRHGLVRVARLPGPGPVIESWIVALVFVGAVTLAVLRVAQRLDARERRDRREDGPRWR